MMKRFRVIAAVLSLALLALSFSGCGPKGEKSESGDEVVELRWILGAQGKLKDSDMVWAEFNKQLPNYLPNTQVTFEAIPFSDYAEKWQLMAASNEKVDLLWSGYALDIYKEVQNGSLLALDDLLKTVPDLTSELPEYLFDLGKVNGKVYVIPNYQIQTNLPYGSKTQAKLAEEYGLDAEKVTATFDKDEVPTKEDYKVFEDYLENLKNAGKLQKGVSPTFLSGIVGHVGRPAKYLETVVANAQIDLLDPDITNVYDVNETDETYLELVNEWFNKGYIRKDILSVTNVEEDDDKEDGYVLWSHSCFKDDSERQTLKNGFPVLSIPTFQYLYIPSTRPTSSTAIARTSENPERAIQLLDLMNTKKGRDLYNLLAFGIEGTHYNKTEQENIIEWLPEQAPGTSADAPYGYANWSIGNIFNGYETQLDTPGWNDYILNEVNAVAGVSPLVGFTFDTEPVKLEVAQYTAIKKEYTYLDRGANNDWKTLREERNEKMKKAGTDKIIEEVRRQIDEWKKIK